MMTKNEPSEPTETRLREPKAVHVYVRFPETGYATSFIARVPDGMTMKTFKEFLMREPSVVDVDPLSGFYSGLFKRWAKEAGLLADPALARVPDLS